MLHLLCSSYCKPHHFHEMGCLADVQQRASRVRYSSFDSSRHDSAERYSSPSLKRDDVSVVGKCKPLAFDMYTTRFQAHLT